MKKTVLFPYFTLIFVFILGSCSVEKRLYRDGYHIEWNTAKNNVKSQDQSQTTVEAIAPTTSGINKENVPDDPFLKEQAIIPEDHSVGNNATASVIAPSKKDASPKKKENLMTRILKEDTSEDQEMIRSGSKAAAFKSGFKKGLKLMMPDDKAHILHLAIASLVLGIVSLFAYYGAFVLGVLAIVFGAIALHKIRNNPSEYRGSTMAVVGIILGIISIAIIVSIIKFY